MSKSRKPGKPKPNHGNQIKRSQNSSQKLKYEEPFKKFLIFNNIDFIP